jgi:putative membrane protein insertion efficiency factor
MAKTRKTWLLAALLLAIIASHDLAVPPQRAFGALAALAAIDTYRAHVSPHLRGVVYCRFTPTCSAYGRESIRKYGLAVGGLRAVWRIARCNPWTPMGTVDPP